MIKTITPVIIAKNADETILETLNSLVEFNEVILYLNNSTDDTKNIGNKFSNVKIIDGDFLGFGPTKNKATQYSSNDWILSLDSDEVILPKLFQEIKDLDLDDNKKVFIIKRDNYFLNKKVKYGGWGNDYIARLYNKHQHHFNNNMVHEFIKIKKNTIKIRLKHSFKHNAIINISQQLLKMERYSTIYAKDKKNKKNSSLFIAILHSLFFFVKNYIFRLGFLDGFAGFMLCISGANSVFYKYIKLYLENSK
ncbi:Putative two-domain glycosyltransferase [hydrothermal vent metagenome]|uniref:Two-domain glycosyltransferase n=1 Tax=hydrothermal vent metagenome TaxID=652676 RepID=A0A3B1E9C8_9ZZZZ